VRVVTSLGLSTIFTATSASASGRPLASRATPVTTPGSSGGTAAPTRTTNDAVTGASPAAVPVRVIGWSPAASAAAACTPILAAPSATGPSGTVTASPAGAPEAASATPPTTPVRVMATAAVAAAPPAVTPTVDGETRRVYGGSATA
jgi:hypothetical protein